MMSQGTQSSRTPETIKKASASTIGTSKVGLSSISTAGSSIHGAQPVEGGSPSVSPLATSDRPVSEQVSPLPKLQRGQTDTISRSLPSNRGQAQQTFEPHLSVDVSSYEAKFALVDGRKQEKHQDLVSFPEDDFIIKTTPKIIRTNGQHQLQKEAFEGGHTLEPFVQTIFTSFTSNWNHVQYNYTNYQRTDSGEEEVFTLPLPGYEEVNSPQQALLLQQQQQQQQQQQGDQEEQQKNMSTKQLALDTDDLHFKLMSPHSSDTDKNNSKERNAGRLAIFKYYEPDYDWEPGTAASMCYRFVDKQNQENPNTFLSQYRTGLVEFMVEVKKLTFSLGDLEPFFCTLALYDIHSKKKISENFHFDENLEKIKELLPQYEINSGGRSGIFSVRNPSEHIYLVLQIEKVFCGELEASTEPYTKAISLKEKEREKSKGSVVSEFKKLSEAPNVNSRVSKFRQMFGFSFLQVFDATGQLLLLKDNCFKTIYPHQAKDNICDLLVEIKERGTKRKDLQGACPLTVTSPIPDTIPRLDSSLDCVLSGNIDESNKHMVSREVQEFSTSPVLTTNWTFINNLYVYPLSLNLNSHDRKFKNILIKMELKANDDPNAPPLKAIYRNQSGDLQLKSEALSEVLYHNKAPVYQDEFKIKLPVNLTPKHHLLFTFYHLVATTKKKKKGKDEQEVEVVCGYSFLPLYPDGKFAVHNNGTYHGIPVVTSSKLEAGYLSEGDKSKKNNLQYLDSGKLLFHISFNLISTLYHQDPYLADLFRFSDGPDQELDKALTNLKKINDTVAVQNFPFIMNLILGVIAKKSKLGFNAVQAIVRLLNIVRVKVAPTEATVGPNSGPIIRAPLLETYVNHVFDLDENAKKNASMLSSLPLSLWMTYRSLKPEKSNPDDFDLTDVGPVSWFFFDIISKSFALFLHHNKSSLEADKSDNRTSRFEPKAEEGTGMQDPRSALTRLTAILSESIKKSLISLSNTGPNTTSIVAIEAAIRELNKSCALFIRDLFSLIDRGQAIKMVQTHLKELGELGSDIIAINLKFDFLRIVADYEHFVPINLPVSISLETLPDVSSNSISKKYLEDHPLVAFLICEVMKTFQTDGNKAMRNIAIGTLYEIMIKHDYDARYQETERKQRVAGLYFLFLIKVIDNIEKKGAIAEYIAQSLHEGGDAEDTTYVAKLIERRDFIICILYALRTCNRSLLRTWWKREITSRLLTFIQILSAATSSFEYLPGKNLQRRKRINIDSNFKKDKKARSEEQNRALHQHISTEVSTLVLDILEDFISDCHREMLVSTGDSIPPLLDSVFKLLILLMQKFQSERFLHFLYASLRSFVIRFSDHFFNIKTSYCGDISYQIFRHCASTLPNIRIEAQTLFYLLLKHNQKKVGNFGRMRIQGITALSKVVSLGLVKYDWLLRESLQRISKYALHEYSLFLSSDEERIQNLKRTELVSSYTRAAFARGVQDLCNILSKILHDTIQVNELKSKADQETIAELYHRIALGYTHTPDLRVQWLQSLAEYHKSIGNFVEQAFCTLHVLALIIDFLQSRQGMNHQESHQLLLSICPTISEFVGDEEGTCQSNVFSESYLLEQLQEAINCLQEAEMHEFAAILFKITIPIYERSHAYAALSKAYRQLDRLWERVGATNEGRLFGKYFRVGFHGELFDKLDSREFVYKMPKLTHLFEFSDRLKNHHAKVFGDGNVIVLPDSNPPDRKKFAAGKVYLQITFLEPYFPDNSATRSTFFERNTKINKFSFETPFAKGGKAHSDSIVEQYKRKTIVTVENPFPYMLTRIPISNKQEIIISPIQNAIDNLQGQLNKILIEINRKPLPDTKTLQQVLQGSALPQVNPGVRLICEGFLGNTETLNSYPKETITKLCEKLKEFLKGCADGLRLHRNLIDDEFGQAFHREVQAGFLQLQTQVNEYLTKCVDISGISPMRDENSNSYDRSSNDSDDDD